MTAATLADPSVYFCYTRAVTKDGLVTIIDRQGEMLISPFDGGITYLRNDSFIHRGNDGSLALCDYSGNVLEDFTALKQTFAAQGKDLYYSAYGFLAAYEPELDRTEYYQTDGSPLFDVPGTTIQLPYYDGESADFWDALPDFLLIEHDGQYGAINRAGELLLPMEYDAIHVLTEDWYHSFHQTFLLEKNGLFGACDMQGNLLLPCIYKQVSIYDDTMLLVETEDGRGLFRQGDAFPVMYSNHEALPPESYLDISYHYPDYSDPFEVTEGGRLLFTASDGALYQIPGSYVDWHNLYADDNVMLYGKPVHFYAVRSEDGWGVLTDSGELVLPFSYDLIYYDSRTGFFSVSQGDAYGSLNYKGEVTRPCDLVYGIEPFGDVVNFIGRWYFLGIDYHNPIYAEEATNLTTEDLYEFY